MCMNVVSWFFSIVHFITGVIPHFVTGVIPLFITGVILHFITAVIPHFITRVLVSGTGLDRENKTGQ